MLETNTSLIRRVRNAQDARSWAEFVSLYEPLLIGYVKSRGLPESDSRDVVQEIFITLLRAVPNFDLDHRKGRFRTWLWQVTMTGIADHFRRRKPQERAKDAWVERARQSGNVAPPDEADPQWETAHRKRVLEFVLPKAKAQTQPKTWHCFEQRILQGRPGPDIAKELGITANAVCVNAARVLEKVRALCAEVDEEFDDADSMSR
ncbi:MAG: sigma-70 family RNA polymerase sigma factor [Gemmataceae bacterium]